MILYCCYVYAIHRRVIALYILKEALGNKSIHILKMEHMPLIIFEHHLIDFFINNTASNNPNKSGLEEVVYMN